MDVRREVTYDVFEKEIWPAIRGKKVRRAAACSTGDPFAGADPSQIAANYHPSLIWTEIISFIKGSVEALLSPTGCLERAQYLELGRKRAPNFMGIEHLHISSYQNSFKIINCHLQPKFQGFINIPRTRFLETTHSFI